MAPASAVGSRTRNKKRSQALSLAKADEEEAKYDSILNDPKETGQTDEFVPLFKVTPNLKIYKRKRNTKSVNETRRRGADTEGIDADNSDKNKDEEVMPAPKKRSCRTKTKKYIECDEEKAEEKHSDKKTKTRKTGRQWQNTESNSKCSVDYKDIIDKQCFVEIKEGDKLNNNFIFTEGTVHVNDKKVEKTNLDQLTSEAVIKEHKDLRNENILKLNGTLNTELVTYQNCEDINDIHGSNDDHKNSHEVKKNTLQTSVPSTTINCLDMRKEIISNNNVTEDICEKRMTFNHNSENHITVPCICNARIQCFGPYSEGSYGSRRIIGNGVEILKSLKHEKIIMAGFIKIQPYSFMSGKATNNTVYFVVEGKLNVNIAGNKKKVSVDDAFMIIQGTEYEIRNSEKELARLSFVKSRLL